MESIGRISSQMTKLSNIIVDAVDDDIISGKFSAFPIDVAELARQSSIGMPGDNDDLAEDGPINTEGGPGSTDVRPTNNDVAPTNTDVAPTNDDVAPTNDEVEGTEVDAGTSADNTAIDAHDTPADADGSTSSYGYIPPSSDGSATFLEDQPVESEPSTSTRRIKSKADKLRSFLKRKKKKGRRERYKESSV